MMLDTVKLYSLALTVMAVTQGTTAGNVCEPYEIGTV